MTLTEWLENHPTAHAKQIEGGGWQVFTTDPTVFQISDHHVSSAVSGPAVILVPKVTEPTLKINGEPHTIPQAREILGVPFNECFGCYLGDCAPQMHDRPKVCEYGSDAYIYTLPPDDDGG